MALVIHVVSLRKGLTIKLTQFFADLMPRSSDHRTRTRLRVARGQLAGNCIHRTRNSIQCCPHGYQKLQRSIDYICRSEPRVTVRIFRRRCVLQNERCKAVPDAQVTDASRRRSRHPPYVMDVYSLRRECSAPGTRIMHGDYRRKVVHLAHEDAQQPRKPSFPAPRGHLGHLPIMRVMGTLHPETPYL